MAELKWVSKEREGAKFCQDVEKGAFGCTGWEYRVVPLQENSPSSGMTAGMPALGLGVLCFSLCRAKRRNGKNLTLTAPASTAPPCALSARLAWGREGRRGKRKRGVGHPLYSVPILFGFPCSEDFPVLMISLFCSDFLGPCGSGLCLALAQWQRMCLCLSV